MSRLVTRLLPIVLAAALLAGCSDPYQQKAGVSTRATSSAASAATPTTAAGGTPTPSPTPSTPTTQDLDQSAQAAGTGPSSADQRAAARAARAFVGPYVLYTYAQAKASQIPTADPSLIAQLAASPPSVPPSVRSRHPKITSLSVSGGQAGEVAFEANVSDGTATYAVPLTVTHEQDGWLVTSVQ